MKSVEPAHLPLLVRAIENGVPFGWTPLVTAPMQAAELVIPVFELTV